MNANPLKPPKGYELVMEHIKKQIESGALPPGTKLSSVVDLAASYGVGRSTIREALSALKAMGWLDIRQGGGTFVKKELPGETTEDKPFGTLFQKTDSLQEVLEVRKLLESGCASLAAVNRSEEDLRLLGEILEEMSSLLDDEAASEQADVRFHLQIAKATGNSLLVQMMESLSQRMHASMKDLRRLWFYAERASAERLLDEHRSVFEAISAQDGSLAGERMLKHLLKVENVLRKANAAGN